MRIVKIMLGMMTCDICDGLQDAIGTKHYMLLIRADLFGPSSIPGGFLKVGVPVWGSPE